mgnify:CR=1 FL=1
MRASRMCFERPQDALFPDQESMEKSRGSDANVELRLISFISEFVGESGDFPVDPLDLRNYWFGSIGGFLNSKS